MRVSKQQTDQQQSMTRCVRNNYQQPTTKHNKIVRENEEKYSQTILHLKWLFYLTDLWSNEGINGATVCFDLTWFRYIASFSVVRVCVCVGVRLLSCRPIPTSIFYFI